MLSTAKDLRDIFEIWGRAVIDLGDADTTFPMSSGRSRTSHGTLLRHVCINVVVLNKLHSLGSPQCFKFTGRHNKGGRLGQRRPKVQVFKHLFAGGMSGAVSRTVVAPLERIKASVLSQYLVYTMVHQIR